MTKNLSFINLNFWLSSQELYGLDPGSWITGSRIRITAFYYCKQRICLNHIFAGRPEAGSAVRHRQQVQLQSGGGSIQDSRARQGAQLINQIVLGSLLTTFPNRMILPRLRSTEPELFDTI